MPRNNNCDYSKTIIYKIVCKDESITDVYVGSTINFIKRRYNHKSASKNFSHINQLKHRKLYITIDNNGGWENWNMLELEMYPCANETEALTRESYWYDKLKANLNSFKPIKSNEEKKHLIAMKNKEEVQKNESP